ncbi:MAG: nitroreductase family protein [Acidimicrobiales bacterium]
MDFGEILRSRRMVRHFTNDPLDDDLVERVIGAGLRAPSAGYSQGTSMLILRSDESRQRLRATHSGSERGWSLSVAEGVFAAPLIIVVLTSKETYLGRYAERDKGWTDHKEARWAVPYWFVDAGCVAMLLLLAAIDEGLGALLFGMRAEDVPTFRHVFRVPDTIDFVGCVAIGHPDPLAPRRDLRGRRRPVDELVHREKW